MDSKEGIEKVAHVNAQVAGLLDPSHLRSRPDDTGTSPLDTGRDPFWADSPTGSSLTLDGFRKRESYCLFVRVLKDSTELLEQDCMILDHSWNAGICKDICEAKAEVTSGSFSVNLLSNMEFLLYKLPKTGKGMTYEEARLYIDFIDGAYLRGSTPAIIYVAQHTHPQSRRDKVKTRDFRCQIMVEQMVAAKACLEELDLATRKCQECKANPKLCGQGMTCWADEHFTW